MLITIFICCNFVSKKCSVITQIAISFDSLCFSSVGCFLMCYCVMVDCLSFCGVVGFLCKFMYMCLFCISWLRCMWCSRRLSVIRLMSSLLICLFSRICILLYSLLGCGVFNRLLSILLCSNISFIFCFSFNLSRIFVIVTTTKYSRWQSGNHKKNCYFSNMCACKTFEFFHFFHPLIFFEHFLSLLRNLVLLFFVAYIIIYYFWYTIYKNLNKE